MFVQKEFDALVDRARVANASHDFACYAFHQNGGTGATARNIKEYELNQCKYWYREKKAAQAALLAYLEA
jgi:hypothetical protein